MMVRKAHFLPAQINRDESSKQYLHEIISGAETALEPLYLTKRDTPMKTVIFRAPNITSVPADTEQTEDLLYDGHSVVVR